MYILLRSLLFIRTRDVVYKGCIRPYKSLLCEIVTSAHQAHSRIDMGRGIIFESASGETATAHMSYGTYHDVVLDQFTYEETSTFPGDGRYTGPCVQKLYNICQECAHMTDGISDIIACIFC